MKLDNDFLTEVGLQDLPEEQKAPFLAHAQEELEIRVGEKISEGLTDAQIAEFEGIMSGDQEVIRRLILDMKKDFREDEIYQKLLKKHGVAQGDWNILGEYLSVKWIQKNRPNYHDIVSETASELKAEISANRNQILSA